MGEGVEKIHSQTWAKLVEEANDSGFILEECWTGQGRKRELYCYTLISNDLGMTDELETVEDIQSSMEEFRHLLLHGA